jgi:crotonobetainyl-CoA:carnitine CoA-transferase CaiB-like acyl-CoA transferase
MLAYQAHIYFATGKSPERMGNAHPTIVPYGVYATKDSYVTLAVGNDRIWDRLCRSLGMDDLITDPKFRTNADREKHRSEVDCSLVEKFAKMSTAELLQTLEKAGVPSGRILSIDQVVNDPQVLHRQMVLEVEHPKLGRTKILGIPIKLSATPGCVFIPPPLLGEHTEKILREIGYNEDEVRNLKAKGVI